MFEGKKRIDLELDTSDASAGHGEWTLERLIDELRRKHLKEKEEMFVQGRSVRPGIIVLVNDTDWELLETTRYKLENGDSVAFISTLHGG
jgi:ubiquitin related modifier 1